ncbi:MAG: MarR family winged helix-turn-helix transcriptional regulator [Streptosporangiales bacterium]
MADQRFEDYFSGIAEAHYVIRKVFRLVDEQAKKAGLEPLEHKLLIQVFGSPNAPLPVHEAAARLDVSPAHASRLVTGLVGRGLVERTAGGGDRRITRVGITAAGRELLAAVDRNVRRHVDLFQYELSDAERDGALRIFAFYVGVRPPLG